MATKFDDLIMRPDASLKSALSKMDETGYKLLMLADSDYLLKGLITIGDIQRAIIANMPLESIALEHSRSDLIVARESDTLEAFKEQMLQYRLVYMPIIDDGGIIKDVVFWDDVFGKKEIPKSSQINLPVVIMAGGFGTRLKPLTNVIPKPLLPYGDSTILENIIERFFKYNCNDFYISVNYKAEFIRFYFDNLNKDYNISFFSEDKPLGTAGSLHLLSDQLNSTFFVSNCDILIDDDYATMLRYHNEHNNELTIVASVKNYNIPYGTIESGENGELVSIKEKPDVNYLINCGMYILEPHLLQEIPKDTFFHITDLIEKVKNRGGKVGVFPISDRSWVDIGEWQHYSKVLFQHL